MEGPGKRQRIQKESWLLAWGSGAILQEGAFHSNLYNMEDALQGGHGIGQVLPALGGTGTEKKGLHCKGENGNIFGKGRWEGFKY